VKTLEMQSKYQNTSELCKSKVK